MKFTVEITCDNAAFEDDPALEVSRILSAIDKDHLFKGALANGSQHQNLRDINGNTVGHAEVNMEHGE